jgi:Tfp pilus assembly protein PilO
MAQPVEYNRQYNFTNYQALQPTAPLPGDEVDNEFNSAKVTLDEIRARLALIQRDDGRLANGSVGNDQLAAVISGLQPPTMKMLPPLQAAEYLEQPIELVIEGGFKGFFTFLSQVEKLPRIVRIHDMKLTDVQREDAEIKAEFTLSIYFQDGARIATGETTGVAP